MENAIIEKVKNQVRSLKVLSDELRVQMALGKAEAKDVLEAERKNLSTYLKKQQKEVRKVESSSIDNRRDFLTTAENLESKLNREIPANYAEYDAYKNSILRNIYKLEEEVKEAYPTLGVDMQDTLDVFKAKMDAYRVNLALHDKDDPAKVERVRNDFTSKLTEVRGLLATKEDNLTRLDNFAEDISESFNYLKRAISDLSN